MQSVPKSERKHIVITGRRNVGKSSLVNAFLGQDLCIVSEVAGTTTDPVKKSMELLPYGPIVIVDTAGYYYMFPFGFRNGLHRLPPFLLQLNYKALSRSAVYGSLTARETKYFFLLLLLQF